ncbi:nicotinate-nucleotide adenylyltransferase [Motilimonas cestriensis]|uniref:nicotinate-nucleotide adenylyltransferase n=1 Tax=Motilimonas cestriensis TaxID=2742685 RepID=UPI003DA5F164
MHSNMTLPLSINPPATTAQLTAPIAIMGGSFNPIHFGHLRPALELQQQLGLAQVKLMPNHVAPHKSHGYSSTEQRCDMIQAAIADMPALCLDMTELSLPQPNYTVATLIALRAANPNTPLCFIIGMDSFINLPTWHRWLELLDYCHLIVCQRPGWQQQYSESLQQHILPKQTSDITQLHQRKHGLLYFTQVTQLDISSSKIRQLRQQQQSIKYLLPDSVIQYIEDNQLYC